MDITAPPLTNWPQFKVFQSPSADNIYLSSIPKATVNADADPHWNGFQR